MLDMPPQHTEGIEKKTFDSFLHKRRMLPKDLYSIWDDRDKSEAEANADYGTGAGKPAKKVEIRAEGKSSVSVQ